MDLADDISMGGTSPQRSADAAAGGNADPGRPGNNSQMAEAAKKGFGGQERSVFEFGKDQSNNPLFQHRGDAFPATGENIAAFAVGSGGRNSGSRSKGGDGGKSRSLLSGTIEQNLDTLQSTDPALYQKKMAEHAARNPLVAAASCSDLRNSSIAGAAAAAAAGAAAGTVVAAQMTSSMRTPPMPTQQHASGTASNTSGSNRKIVKARRPGGSGPFSDGTGRPPLPTGLSSTPLTSGKKRKTDDADASSSLLRSAVASAKQRSRSGKGLKVQYNEYADEGGQLDFYNWRHSVYTGGCQMQSVIICRVKRGWTVSEAYKGLPSEPTGRGTRTDEEAEEMHRTYLAADGSVGATTPRSAGTDTAPSTPTSAPATGSFGFQTPANGGRVALMQFPSPTMQFASPGLQEKAMELVLDARAKRQKRNEEMTSAQERRVEAAIAAREAAKAAASASSDAAEKVFQVNMEENKRDEEDMATTIQILAAPVGPGAATGPPSADASKSRPANATDAGMPVLDLFGSKPKEEKDLIDLAGPVEETLLPADPGIPNAFCSEFDNGGAEQNETGAYFDPKIMVDDVASAPASSGTIGLDKHGEDPQDRPFVGTTDGDLHGPNTNNFDRGGDLSTENGTGSTQNTVVRTSRYGFTVGQDVHVLGKDGERHACRIMKVVQPSGGQSMCTVRKIFQPSKDYVETIPESKIVGWINIVEQPYEGTTHEGEVIIYQVLVGENTRYDCKIVSSTRRSSGEIVYTVEILQDPNTGKEGTVSHELLVRKGVMPSACTAKYEIGDSVFSAKNPTEWEGEGKISEVRLRSDGSFIYDVRYGGENGDTVDVENVALNVDEGDLILSADSGLDH